MLYQGGSGWCFGGLHTGCTPVAHRLEFDEKMGHGETAEVVMRLV